MTRRKASRETGRQVLDGVIQMATEAQRTADALRYVMQDLDHSIEVIRRKLRKGMYVKGEKYLSLIRQAEELRAAGAALGLDGPLFHLVEPIPYRTGFVGISREEVKAREWLGAGDFWGGRTVDNRRIAA